VKTTRTLARAALQVFNGATPVLEEAATLNYLYQQQKYNVSWCVPPAGQ